MAILGIMRFWGFLGNFRDRTKNELKILWSSFLKKDTQKNGQR